MAVGQLIDRKHVVVGLRVPDKLRLLEQLARRAASELSLDEQAVFQELWRREELGSTGLGKGFALPHARMRMLSEAFTLFVRLARPIEFQAIDGKPVDIVILLLTPLGADSQHLATLAALSRSLREEILLQRLRRAPDAEAAYKVLSGA
jgi:PTS system nitrogen regulatory IIA component